MDELSPSSIPRPSSPSRRPRSSPWVRRKGTRRPLWLIGVPRLTMTIPKMLEEIREEGIKAIVEDSYYLSGAYDWAIILTVEDNRDLIRFMELWRKHYGEYFSRVIQSEVMFISTRNSKLNPNLSEIGNLLK